MIGLNRILVGDAAKTLRKLPDGFGGLRGHEPAVLPAAQLPARRATRTRSARPRLGRTSCASCSVRSAASSPRPAPSGSTSATATRPARLKERSAKSLLLGPERLALALMKDGWIVRNKIVWAKRNPMPSPARDRLAPTWEAIYLLVRQRDYFFDLDAIRVPHKTKTKPATPKRGWSVPPDWRVSTSSNSGLDALNAEGRVGHPLGKNPGDVWLLSTASYRGPHHAVFPAASWSARSWPAARRGAARAAGHRGGERPIRRLGHLAVRGDLQPTCTCAAKWEPGLVLDPFIGSGTTAIAAEALGRNWLGIELNPTFARLAEERIAAAREKQRRAA